MKLPKEVEIALKLLKTSGFEAYLVGGCVRDSILDIEQKDFESHDRCGTLSNT
jgi:tRNA nucleotidyltransferase (CCA-adding enzyme)